MSKKLKTLGTFVFLLIFLECITYSSSEIIRCAFKVKQWDDYVGKPYTCVAMNVNFPTKTIVDRANGRHTKKLGDNDVKALDISNQNVAYFPTDIEKTFSNLEALAIVNSKLQSISKKDLESFPKLITINFAGNLIKQLGFALLSSNPLLKKISFAENPLIGIGSDLIDTLEGIEQVDFSNANCIDSKAESVDELDTVKSAINEMCPPTADMVNLQESDMKFYFCKDQLDNATSSLDVCNVSWEMCSAEYEKLDDQHKECQQSLEKCDADEAKECKDKMKELEAKIEADAETIRKLEADADKLQKLEAQVIKLKDDYKKLQNNFDSELLKQQTCKSELKQCKDSTVVVAGPESSSSSGCVDQLQLVIECDQFYGTTCVSESTLIPFQGMKVNGVKLPNGTVIDGKHITELQISGGAVRAIPENFGQYFTNLVTLVMDSVRVEEINKNSFNGSHKLTNLTMTNGKLAHIHPDAFASAPNIAVVDFTKNELTDISKAIQELGKINVLVLESNQINTVEWNKFDKMTDIEVISINNNPLEHVDSGFLDTSVFTNLVSVDMVGSKCVNLKYPTASAEKIKQSLYKDCPFKVSLECEFKMVKSDYVCDAKNTFIYYENTLISGIVGEHLSESNTLSDVTKLTIGPDQVLHYVPPNLFKQFGKVEKVEIDKTGLKEVAHMNGLTEIVITNNNLTTITDTSFNGSPDVEIITLTGNQIEKLTDGAFNNNKKVKTFDVSNNLLANFTSTSIETLLGTDASIDLSSNKLSNVVWSFTKPTTSKIIATNNQCISGKSGKNMEAFVKEIQDGCSQKDELECEFKYLDGEYTCFAKNFNVIAENTKITRIHGTHTEPGKSSKSVTKFVVANQNMEYFPINIMEVFPALTKVEVTSSNLKKISSFVGQNLEWIKITGNKIDKIEDNSFVGSPLLSYIDISNNGILKISKDIFESNLELSEVNLSKNRLETINWAMFTAMSMLESVDISYNKLKQIDWTQVSADLQSIDLTGNECINMKYTANVKNKFMDAINTNCGRETIVNCRFKVQGSEYTCHTVNLEILNENTRITRILGDHVSGKTNKDVTRFMAVNQKVVYFPINIRKFFTHLRLVDIINKNFRLKVIFLSDTEFTKEATSSH
ncbi:slit homolog 1 protein-like [Chironomus tepperi]|uniref:slit homolog 1 protein-like n=1 Tax=Chironomus tepperi TaxID=113505 RepID=UPI00391EF59A